MIITEQEKKDYPLKLEIDQDIFMRIKELEKKNLNPEDKKMLIFIKTQMEANWRKPLVTELEKIEKNV